MFQLIRNITDQGIYVEVTDFRQGVEDLKTELFQKPENADIYIYAKMQRYMAFHLSRYVYHSINIKRNSNSGYYHSNEFEQALETCKIAIRNLEVKSYYDIAKIVRNNFQYLKGILPHASNLSYNRSLATLTELKNLSEKYL